MSIEIARLTCPQTGATAEVAVGLGFNCYSWKSPFGEGGEPRELLWSEPGFDSGDVRPSSSGIPLLAPFAGRIAGAAFEWDGHGYALEPTGGAHAIHGFALRRPWRTTEQAADRVTAEYQPSVDDPMALGQWPADFRLTATYRLVGRRLVLDFAAENVGDQSMPFGFGTHAYFRLPLAEGADPEATLLNANVTDEWLSAGLIPTGETEPVGPDNPLPQGAALAGHEFDTPYRLADGSTQTEVSDPASGHGVRQTFDTSMTCCVVYTPGHREAICLEPYTCVPDPIGLESQGIATGLITLAPRERYETTVVLEAFKRAT